MTEIEVKSVKKKLNKKLCTNKSYKNLRTGQITLNKKINWILRIIRRKDQKRKTKAGKTWSIDLKKGRNRKQSCLRTWKQAHRNRKKTRIDQRINWQPGKSEARIKRKQ